MGSANHAWIIFKKKKSGLFKVNSYNLNIYLSLIMEFLQHSSLCGRNTQFLSLTYFSNCSYALKHEMSLSNTVFHKTAVNFIIVGKNSFVVVLVGPVPQLFLSSL